MSRDRGSVVYAAPIWRVEPDTSLKASIKSEKWRCIAYIFFWTMVLLARILSKYFVVDRLAAGPPSTTPIEQLGCGPFNREDEGFGVGLGQGFDYYSQTHLQEFFGFPNVCTSWDYTPSREITGMYFPLFEYSLVIYLFLDYLSTKMAYKRGQLPKWYIGLSTVVLVITIVLCVWFRMIFIFIAYENVSHHTLAFLGLQIALVLVAFMNTLYVIMTGQSYPSVGLSLSKTRCLAWTYLIGLLAISYFKIEGTIYIVINGIGSPFYKKPVEFLDGWVWGEVIDKIWMIFNAVLPFFIALVRARHEAPLEFKITTPKLHYEGESDDENASLL